MEKNRLSQLPKSCKWAITAFLLLTSIGFGVALLMSCEHYGISHQKTVTYYLGNEQEMAFPKLFSQLLQTAHVHSFTMPLVFLMVWLGLQWTPLRSSFKTSSVLGGSISILLYNSAPFLLRYGSPKAVWLFSIGGTGLFVFFFIPAIAILYETWVGYGARG